MLSRGTAMRYPSMRRPAREPAFTDISPSKKLRTEPEGLPTFSDSPYIIKGTALLSIHSGYHSTLLGTTLTLDNEKVNACLESAEALLKDPANIHNPSELVTCRLIGDLQAEIICDVHKIDFILKRRALLAKQLFTLQRSLDMTGVDAATSK